MTLKKWLRLFSITLLIGVSIMMVTGLIRYLFDANFIVQFQVDNFGYFVIFLFLLGTIYGTLSHIMFFCFLVINLIGRGVIHYRFLWQGTQLIVVASLVVIFLGYLKQMYLPAFVLIVSSALVAYYKAKLTNFSAFVPTFFFMSIGTFLTLIQVMEKQEELLFIMPTVLVCNAWQIVQLHQLVKKTNDESSQPGINAVDNVSKLKQ